MALRLEKLYACLAPSQSHQYRRLFWGLITLAKVMKIEIGDPHEFDRPATEDEALDRMERNAGPTALQDAGAVLEAAEESGSDEEQSAD